MAARVSARLTRACRSALAIAGLLALGCASGEAPGADGEPAADPPTSVAAEPERPQAAEVLVIAGFAFDPEDLLVGADRQQRVRNDDGVAHTITAWDGSFDLRIEPGEEVVLRAPPERGIYPYACTLHPQMRGEIEVG